MEHGEPVERQDDKAALKRVRNPKGLIENGKPRLCHNRAIEFLGAEVFVAPRKQGSKRAQRTGLGWLKRRQQHGAARGRV
jgi:hypothetical protein